MSCDIAIGTVKLTSDSKTITLPAPQYGTDWGGGSQVVTNKTHSYNRRRPVCDFNFFFDERCIPALTETEIAEFVRTEGYKKITMSDQYGDDYVGFISSSVKITTAWEMDGQRYYTVKFSFKGARQ